MYLCVPTTNMKISPKQIAARIVYSNYLTYYYNFANLNETKAPSLIKLRHDSKGKMTTSQTEVRPFANSVDTRKHTRQELGRLLIRFSNFHVLFYRRCFGCSVCVRSATHRCLLRFPDQRDSRDEVLEHAQVYFVVVYSIY